MTTLTAPNTLTTAAQPTTSSGTEPTNRQTSQESQLSQLATPPAPSTLRRSSRSSVVRNDQQGMSAQSNRPLPSGSQISTQTPVSVARNCDIKCGRGGGTNHHPGNKTFRDVVNAHKMEYMQAKRLDKVLIAKVVINEVKTRLHTEGAEPQFLKKILTRGGQEAWVPISDKAILLKTSQALREGAPKLRTTLQENSAHHNSTSRSASPQEELNRDTANPINQTENQTEHQTESAISEAQSETAPENLDDDTAFELIDDLDDLPPLPPLEPADLNEFPAIENDSDQKPAARPATITRQDSDRSTGSNLFRMLEEHDSELDKELADLMAEPETLPDPFAPTIDDIVFREKGYRSEINNAFISVVSHNAVRYHNESSVVKKTQIIKSVYQAFITHDKPARFFSRHPQTQQWTQLSELHSLMSIEKAFDATVVNENSKDR